MSGDNSVDLNESILQLEKKNMAFAFENAPTLGVMILLADAKHALASILL